MQRCTSARLVIAVARTDVAGRFTPIKGPAVSSPQHNPKEIRALHVISILTGFASVIAYPVAVLHPPAAILFLGMPVALATSGRLRNVRSSGLAATLLAVGLVVGFMRLVPFLMDVVIVVGTLTILVFVTAAIRERDRIAAALWIGSSVAAFIIGLLLTSTSPNAAIGAIVILVGLGVVYPLLRLRRRQDLAT